MSRINRGHKYFHKFQIGGSVHKYQSMAKFYKVQLPQQYFTKMETILMRQLQRTESSRTAIQNCH